MRLAPLFYFPWLRFSARASSKGAGLGLLLSLPLSLVAQPQTAVPRYRPASVANPSGPAALDTLTGQPALCAVGMAEGGGEILILGDEAFTTRHRPDGTTETTTGFQGRAVWLLRSRVTQWEDAGPVPAAISSAAALARFIRQALARAGLDLRATQPFRLVGESRTVWWHVAAFPTARPLDAAAAGQGARGCFVRESMSVVGFSPPPTRRKSPLVLHMHGRPGAQPFVAHLDSLRPGAGLHLLLPALP